MFRISIGLQCLIIAFPALMLSSGAKATEDKTLSTVTVSSDKYREELAPRSARNAFRVTESSDTHTQTISREEIEQLRPRDVLELLNNATGVIATQSSRKGFSGLSIRGDSNFRWIIDGANLQPTMASRIMKSLPVSAIEEIKIVRGASALTMGPMTGSASPGGAPVDGFIIISTRKPARDQVQIRAAFESHDTQQLSLWGGKTLGEKSGDTHGYVAGLIGYSNNGSPSENLDNGATYNVGRHASSGMLKGGFDAADWMVDVLAYHDEGDFQIPNANSHGTGQANWYMDPAKTDIFSLTANKAWNGIHTTLFSLSHSTSKQTFWTANTAAGPYSSVQNDNTLTHANLRHNIDFQKTRLVVGGDYLHWDAPNGQQYYEGIQREEKTRSWFGQIEHKLFEDKLALDASYRRDRVLVLHGLDYYTGGAQPFGGTASPLKTQDKTLPVATFYSLGAAWRFNQQWRMLGRYGESKQASDGLNPVAGTQLSDDQQRKWELGVEGQVYRWLNPSLNYFHRAVQNEKNLAGYTYIATNGSTQTCRAGTIPTSGSLAPRNTSVLTPCYAQADTTRDGFEWVLSGNFAERSYYRASLTHFTAMKNASDITPRNIADLSISHGFGAYTLSGAIKYVSPYKGALTDSQTYLGGYTRFDIGLGYDFKLADSNVRTTLYGRNLSNEKYETTNGIQDIGRVLGIEAVLSF